MEISDQPGSIIHFSPSLSHTPPLLAQLLYKFSVHLLALPAWLPPSSHFSSLMAECVCIDTAPQSYTAERGQCGPAAGLCNDKVNEGGWDSDMPPWAVPGSRGEEMWREGNVWEERWKGEDRKKKKRQKDCKGKRRKRRQENMIEREEVRRGEGNSS